MEEWAEHLLGFIAGLLGGCAGLIVGHPLDTVKVRQQCVKAKYCGNMFKAIRMTFIHDGLIGFYKGMAFPLISVGLLNSVFFGVYDNTLRYICKLRHGDKNAKPRYLDIFLVAGFAGSVQAIPACTIELVKVKLQSQMNMAPNNRMTKRYRGPLTSVLSMIHKEHGMDGIIRGIGSRMASRNVDISQPMSADAAPKHHYTGPLNCLQSVYKQHGLRGCFKGLPGTISREMPGFSVYMVSYAYLCDQLDNRAKDDASSSPKFSVLLTAGGLAGVISWLGNIPFDVIKNRMQADRMDKPRYNGYWDCITKSYREDGFRVFWRGLPVTCLRAFPVNAVTLSVYSGTMYWMQSFLKNKDKSDF